MEGLPANAGINTVTNYINGLKNVISSHKSGEMAFFLEKQLPLAYYMSIQPDASLTKIGLAAPVATIFGIVLNVIFYLWMNQKNVSVDEE